jgi:hypothetical protein
MARTWVLDTETKGTGAEMVPLEKVQQRRRSAQEGARAAERRRLRRRFRKRAPEPAAERPRQPRRFKVVDVMSRQVLAEDVAVRSVLELLGESRSVVDSIVYVWDREQDDWRPLTMREQKLLWDQRGAQAAARSANGSDSPVS